MITRVCQLKQVFEENPPRLTEIPNNPGYLASIQNIALIEHDERNGKSYPEVRVDEIHLRAFLVSSVMVPLKSLELPLALDAFDIAAQRDSTCSSLP